MRITDRWVPQFPCPKKALAQPGIPFFILIAPLCRLYTGPFSFLAAGQGKRSKQTYVAVSYYSPIEKAIRYARIFVF
jgi:hypothetical protein